MNLQERVTALMFAENDRMLSRVTPRFFALWEGNTVDLSTVMETSWSGQPFPGRKSSSVLTRLSLRWWADIQAEMSARHTEMHVATWVSEGGRRRVVECHPHSNDRRDHVRTEWLGLQRKEENHNNSDWINHPSFNTKYWWALRNIIIFDKLLPYLFDLIYILVVWRFWFLKMTQNVNLIL